MRPAGEVRQALMEAARELVKELGQPSRGPTLAEMSARAQVGRDAARQCISNMTRASGTNALRIVGVRRVDYRNKPVAEYSPADLCQTMEPAWAGLGQCMADWVR